MWPIRWHLSTCILNKTIFCCNKFIFVATNLLQQKKFLLVQIKTVQNFVATKFVATKIFSLLGQICLNKVFFFVATKFVATKFFSLLRQICLYKVFFFVATRFVATKFFSLLVQSFIFCCNKSCCTKVD